MTNEVTIWLACCDGQEVIVTPLWDKLRDELRSIPVRRSEVGVVIDKNYGRCGFYLKLGKYVSAHLKLDDGTT